MEGKGPNDCPYGAITSHFFSAYQARNKSWCSLIIKLIYTTAQSQLQMRLIFMPYKDSVKSHWACLWNLVREA